MPHNRELMQVFKDVGLVEQLGSGMSQILKTYDKSIFDISEHFINVQIPFLCQRLFPTSPMKLAMKIKFWQCLKENQQSTNYTYDKENGLLY